MKPHVSIITLGVSDMNRAKQFYSEGLGWPILQEHGTWVAFVAADGSGFRGVTLSYIVRSEDRVEGVLAEAKRAGGKIAKTAERQPWGGSRGYLKDPDGYLWKVAAGGGKQFAAE
jgi:predicted enzyme related to lactoylglutathione lyase